MKFAVCDPAKRFYSLQNFHVHVLQIKWIIDIIMQAVWFSIQAIYYIPSAKLGKQPFINLTDQVCEDPT